MARREALDDFEEEFDLGSVPLKGRNRVDTQDRRSLPKDRPVAPRFAGPAVVPFSAVDAEALQPLSPEENEGRIDQRITAQNALCAYLLFSGDLTPEWKKYKENHEQEIAFFVQQLKGI